jgi:hypothetical protein
MTKKQSIDFLIECLVVTCFWIIMSLFIQISYEKAMLIGITSLITLFIMDVIILPAIHKVFKFLSGLF